MSLRKRLASQTALMFSSRIFGAGIIFLGQALIARIWGAQILGEYLLVIATVNLISIFLPLGFHTVGMYFAARYAAAENRSMLWRFMAWSYGHIFITGALVALLCAPVASWFGGSGHTIAELSGPITLLAVATALVYVNLEVLIGLKRPLVGFFVEIIMRPVLMIAAFTFAALYFDGATALRLMLWLFALGYTSIAAAQFILVFKSVKGVADTAPRTAKAELGRWWRFALPWVLIALATDFFFDVNMLLLSGYMHPEQLAVFGICTRIFALIAFGITAAYALVLPDMCEADTQSDKAAFAQKIADANFIAVGTALLLVGAVSVGGHIALQLFGEKFADGTWPLVILSLALLVRAMFGPASVVLSILDRPHTCLPAVGAGLLSLATFNAWLVPDFGLMGASMAVLAAITTWSAALWLTALYITKIDVSILPRIRTFLRGDATHSDAVSAAPDRKLHLEPGQGI